MKPAQTPLTVFYDGACPRCVEDRCHYERLAGDNAGEVTWFDITNQDQALRRLGIDPTKALTELHVQTADGRILSELDAYIALLQRVPRLRPLAWLLGLPLIRPLAARYYHSSVTRRLARSGRLPPAKKS
ncbi:DUF393 domain-containing protein [Shewanella sp. AS16]|uniref:thiol-disulfide oxidoreductase DCC family protein n=1 Tax=Shewanella sp. AS16 TaxID=2907625 RepID=UPI001F2D5661|nr:DUF393 domain-containing protein [Shewanella sp. AS16]MCE9687253.1 DUF393 domain-containing protein [Shewanella sp. AS16]